MVRTGARAGALARLLTSAGLEVRTNVPQPPRLSDLDDSVADSIVDLYRALGGTSSTPALRPGRWDLALGDDSVLELDEELHFNRYRRMTLEPGWARQLPWRPEYVELCASAESLCLAAGRWGKRWTNPSCEAMFGGGAPPGDFDAGGAPRWKQRALYDAIKDGFAASRRDYRVVRLSVHDSVGGRRLGQVLEAGATVDAPRLLELVERRKA